VRNAIVEIWQCDAEGVYLHSQDVTRKPRDTNFQGFGRFLTDASGAYYFRTIKPVPYPGRTPHIHVKVKKGGRELLTTQLLREGAPGQREGRHLAVGARFTPARRDHRRVHCRCGGSSIGELTARFDVVVGRA
jgi:protocatechuate 3,4-dioxygenase, beta subunit